MSKIVAVKKGSDGDLEAFKLDNGKEVDLNTAISMAKNDEIEDVLVGKDKLGRDTIRSKKDDTPNNNLSNLPIF